MKNHEVVTRKEYIEREAAKEKLCCMCRWEGTTNCEECEHPIDDIPAADVAPVAHGRWEQKEVFEAKGRVDELQSAFCPVCQRYHTTPYSYYFTHYNYCPNCGALMDKEGCGE